MKILKMLWKLIPLLNEILSVSKKKKKISWADDVRERGPFHEKPAFPCSELITETLEQGVKYIQS